MLIVGFQDGVRSRGLAWLKRGFRHCFAYQAHDEHWVLCDPLSAGLVLRAAARLDQRLLLTSLAALGMSAVAVERNLTGGPMAWLRPLTCVEFCKRLTGDRGAWPITPHQLFRHLARRKSKP